MSAAAAPRPRTDAAPVAYRVEIADANAHLLRVTLTLRQPAAEQRLSLPV